MVRHWIPDRGDLVWLEFGSGPGHEQAGHRPAMVLSPETYNRKVGLALLCPITSQVKGYPFEVVLPEGLEITGAILSDQIKSLDWRTRRAKKAGTAPASVVQEVQAKVRLVVGGD
jgi:mRNA interferase MazF